MKRCIEEHHAAGFGTIPVGSLWDDESPYIGAAAKFVDADAPEPIAKPVKKSAPTRKFGEKKGDG
jgi:hypothetical protein